MIINLIVGSTNLVGLYYILCYKTNLHQSLQIIFPMCASILYHLADTNHGLDGLYPLNIYSNQLLFVDRFFAIISGITCLYKLAYIKNPTQTNVFTYGLVGLVGLVCLIISERDMVSQGFTVGKYEFLFFHSLWHIIAFNILCLITINH